MSDDTIHDICTALQFAAALLSEAGEFPRGPQDAAGIEVLAAAIADGEVTIPPGVLAEIREAMGGPGRRPGHATAEAAARLLEALDGLPRRS